MSKEIDMVSLQANMSATIATEHLAAKKWWEDFGLCYIENSSLEDFTFEKRIEKLKGEINGSKYKGVALRTSHAAYGKGKGFKSCGEKNYGIRRDHTIG